MQKILKKVFSAPSIKLNVLVVLEIVLLLLVSLGGLFYFTRRALVEETKKDAEQRLEGTVQHVDNVLLSVEQTAGNFYYELLDHLNEPDRMMTYCRRLVESNPNVMGCSIAFKPNFFPEHEQFIRFVYRKHYNSPELVQMQKSPTIPYTQQNWYTGTMKNCRPTWLDPGQNYQDDLESIVTFCLPINYKKDCVGVIAVGLSVNLLSQIVQENKPTPNSYSILLGHDGTYLIHPDREKLSGKTVFDVPEVAESPTAVETAKAMLGNQSGERSFQLKGQTLYLFYKPFVRTNIPGRSLDALNWSIATVYPKSDIFGEYNHLVVHVLVIAFAGLLLFYLLCRMVIRKQLQPLSYLTVSAERIAEGHYDETIPATKRTDEVGVFQDHFRLMQQALATDIAKREQLGATLEQHREELQKTLQQIHDDDNVKTIFLHNVTDKMIKPSESILDSVNRLCDNYQNLTLAEADKETENIKLQSETIRELLRHKFNAIPSGTPAAGTEGKEEHHE